MTAPPTPSQPLQILIQHLRPQRTSAVIALTLMLIEVGIEVSYPLLLALLIDRGILTGDLTQVMLWGGIMLAITLLGFVCGIISTFFASDTGISFAKDLRATIFQKVMSLPIRGVQRFGCASLLTRATNDVHQIQTAVYYCVRLYLRAPLAIAGSVVLALVVDAKLALPLLLATPLLIIVLHWVIRHGMQLFLAAQEQLDRVTNLLRENLRGLWLIRAFDRQSDELRRFAKGNAALASASAAAMRLSEMTVPSLLLLLNLCAIIILLQGGERVQSLTAQPGEVVAILNYAFRIITEFSHLPAILTNLSRAHSALQRISEVIAQSSEQITTSATITEPLRRPPSVAFKDVLVRHPGNPTPALGPLNFDLAARSTLAVVGATGSGKSTLLQLVPGLFTPDEGQILIDGRPMEDWLLTALRSGIGYVQQPVQLSSGALRDVLLWGGVTADESQIVKATTAAQIHDQISQWSDGYQTRLEQRAANLSGGQRQRLAVARAILRKPALLLLDDCTSALDVLTEARLMNAIGNLDCTVIFATQKIASAQRADVILLLDREEGNPIGTHVELLQRSATYRRLVQSQRDAAPEPEHA